MLGEQHDPALPQPLRQSSSRKPLSASLPRETRTLSPAETARPACGGEFSVLGCDVSEQLELISGTFKVIETRQPKLACCSCDHIAQAPMPSKPIERSYAGPGLLARIVTAKFTEHAADSAVGVREGRPQRGVTTAACDVVRVLTGPQGSPSAATLRRRAHHWSGLHGAYAQKNPRRSCLHADRHHHRSSKAHR